MSDTKRMTDERFAHFCQGMDEMRRRGLSVTDPASEVLDETRRARQSEAAKSEALTMALHVLESYEEQAVKVHVILLNDIGVTILQNLIARVRKALA
jgi:hypothetical protein